MDYAWKFQDGLCMEIPRRLTYKIMQHARNSFAVSKCVWYKWSGIFLVYVCKLRRGRMKNGTPGKVSEGGGVHLRGMVCGEVDTWF